MQTPNIPVLLAEAHTCSRIGQYQVLVGAGFEIVGEAESVEELGQQLNEYTSPFLLLLACNLLPEESIRFIFDICQQQPDYPIVLLLNNCHDLPLLALVDAGIKGMVAKTEATQTLVWAIQTAAAGERAMSPMVMDRLLQPDPSTEIALDALEKKLLQLICTEKTNPEIAVELHTSPKTVERRLTALYAKLKVKSRVGAAVWFCQYENGSKTSTRR